eukprot:1151200-Pelagomonas_calceolata.AAC.4
MREKFKFCKLFNRKFGQEEGGREKGRQSPLHFAEEGKGSTTALLKCDTMRVKFEFDEVRGSSHGTTLRSSLL